MLKHYIYVSDTKVDMLAAQVPRKLRDRIAADLQLDLKVLAVSLKQAPGEETRYSKVALITRYLSDHAEIGTPDLPKAYFAGSLPMRWGELRDAPQAEQKGPSAVYFVGETEATVVALGGSMVHVLGTATSVEDREMSRSLGPSLLALLRVNAKDEFAYDEDDDDWDHYERSLQKNASGFLNSPHRRLAPEEPVEFLARRLRYWPSGGQHEGTQAALLGSPIWVAYGDC